MKWDPDSRHIIAASVHTPQSRGYPYAAKWRFDVDTGERELLGEWLLLLSKEVAERRLEPLPPEAEPDRVVEILERLAESDESWVRRAALATLATVRERK